MLTISRLAKDFFFRVCKINPDVRYTAKEALNHPWITRKFETIIPLSHREAQDHRIAKRDLITVVRTMLFLAQFPSVKLELDLNEQFKDTTPIDYQTTSDTKLKINSIFSRKNSASGARNPYMLKIYSPTLFKPSSNNSFNTSQSIKGHEIEWESSGSKNSEKYKLSDSSKGLHKIKLTRIQTSSSFGSSVEVKKSSSPMLISSKMIRKHTESMGTLQLPPLSKSEKLAMNIQKSVFSKMPAAKKRKSKFGPEINQDNEIIDMRKTDYRGFIAKSDDKEKPYKKLRGISSHKNLGIEQGVIIISTPTRLIIK